VIDAEAITEEVRALERLDLSGLRAAWSRSYGDPPKLRSPELLRLMLAWRIQAAAFGALDGRVKRSLRRASPAASRPDAGLGVGARIEREWRGVTYVVETVEGGYRWEGRVYPSLSAVAFAITGVKRNGPQFFGLRETAA
jgi:hypothetical protein